VAVLGAAFQIGRSALAAYQSAIAITGQNIANVGNPDYTRQTGRLVAMYGGMTLGGVAPGMGVNLSGLQRHVDEAVEARLRLALGDRAGAQPAYPALHRIESLYNELTQYDLSTQLTTFFGSFSDVQTNPADISARNLILANADTVIQTLQRQRTGLLSEISDLNDTVASLARDANALTEQLATLHELIGTTEAQSPGSAGALRDNRDALLRQLGELMDITTREQDNGVVNVYVGSEPLVDFNRSRGLTTETVRADGLARTTLRFADNNSSVIARSGKLAAIAETRDVHLAGQLERLDQLAKALIYEVNCVHSSGQGLVGYQRLQGSYAVRDASAALNSAEAGLPFDVQNGTFFVRVRDQATGQVTTQMIEVDLAGLNNDDTTLSSLAAALSAVPGLNATVTGDNRLRIDAAAGFEVSFADDTSHALAALGIGTFFTGTDAATIAVNAALTSNPRLLAAALDGAAGDGRNAGRLAALGSATSALLGGVSIEAYHAMTINGLAVTTAAASTAQEAADMVYSSLLAQREATSGVSLDEEAINLTKYERAFQGASRFLNVLDSLSDEILSLVS